MPYYLYILENPAGRYYIGVTADLERRLREHDRGQSLSTRGRGPWTLAHLEQYETFSDARSRESEIKKKKRKSYLEWLMR